MSLKSPALARQPVTAFVALGANLGDPQAALQQAMLDLSQLNGVTLVSRSSLYQTAPVDSSGPDYVNAVVEISTILTAPALMDQLQKLEQSAGRERLFLNAPRTLDLDLLLYGDSNVSSPKLEVPHPRMFERAFVLVPLAEIAPAQVSPAQLTGVAKQEITRCHLSESR